MTHPTTIRRVRDRRPRLPDLFSCTGGAGKGYETAQRRWDAVGADGSRPSAPSGEWAGDPP